MSGIAATRPAHQTKSITPKARAVHCMYGACPRTVQSVDWWSQLRLVSTVHCPNATLDEWAQTQTPHSDDSICRMQGSMMTSELRDQQHDIQDDIASVCDEELAQKHLVSILERISALGRSHQPAEQAKTHRSAISNRTLRVGSAGVNAIGSAISSPKVERDHAGDITRELRDERRPSKWQKERK